MSEPTLLDKWRLVLAVVSDPKMSRADVGVIAHISERYNEKHGYAWPGYDTLAEDIGAHRTTAIRSVASLVKAGYVEIISKGGRSGGHDGKNYSNRYRPCFERGLRDTVAQAHTNPHDTVAQAHTNPHDTVAQAQSKGSADATETVAPTRPEPSYPPRPKGKGGEEEGAPLFTAAAADTPPPPRTAKRTDDRLTKDFETFWTAYPKQEGWASAKQEFCRLVENGEAAAADLIDGAERYAAAMKAVGKEARWIAAPGNWLKREQWRDTWEVPKPQPARESKTIKVSPGKAGRERPTAQRVKATKKAVGKAAPKVKRSSSTSRSQPVEFRVGEMVWNPVHGIGKICNVALGAAPTVSFLWKGGSDPKVFGHSEGDTIRQVPVIDLIKPRTSFKSYAAIVHKGREKRRLTSAQLADMVGVHVLTILRIENGFEEPGPDLRRRIADAIYPLSSTPSSDQQAQASGGAVPDRGAWGLRSGKSARRKG